MTSCIGSLANFKEEPRAEGLDFCFNVRGEPDELLGESGGALPLGNMEGNELLPTAFTLEKFAEALTVVPAFASSIKDFTCAHVKKEEMKACCMTKHPIYLVGMNL